MTIYQDISDRKEKEEILQLREAYFRTLFENVPDAMIIIDAETGKFVDANAKAVRLFGLERDKLIGIGPLDISPPVQPDGRASKEMVHEKIQELLSEHPQPFEWVHSHASGRDILCEIRHTKLPIRERMFYCAMAIDITERRRAENELTQYKHIIESTKNPVGLVDRNYIYRYVNEPYCQALNRPFREIIGHSVPELFGRNIFETVMQPHYKRCFAGEIVDYQAWFDFPGWGRRYMDVRYYPFQEGDGQIVAAVVNVHDITEIKQMEMKLRESEALFRAFMDNNPAAIYIKDKDDVHLYGNHLAAVAVGTKPEDLIGSTTRDFFPPELATRLIDLDQRILNENIGRVTEIYKITDKENIRWFRDLKFPINIRPGEKLLGGIASDITDLKMAQDKLEELSQFDQMLTRLSVSFIDLPLEGLDRAINDALEQIGQFFGLDRCSFGHLTSDGKEVRITHVWNRKVLTGTRMSYPVTQYPWLLSPFVTGKALVWSRSEEVPDGSEAEIRFLEESGMQSFAGIPVKIAGKPTNCLGFSDTTHPRTWDHHIIGQFPLIADLFGNVIGRKQTDVKLQMAFREIDELKNRLEQENIYLREEIRLRHKHEEIVGKSEPILKMLNLAEQVAETDATVLLLGETGTGKELLANAIHRLSRRKDRTMITVNCAALPATLIESELFGREKGAYTGAMSRQIGRFEIADGSTLFLDEIGELPLELQAKLLRVLQEGQFERLGSPRTISVNVRIIASTNRDLTTATREGRFREDLYYRLNVFSITVPPLRERTRDLPLLIWSFIKKFEKSMGKTVHKIPPKSLDALKQYSWPGNIRELKNVVENAMIISQSKILKITPPVALTTDVQKNLKLEDVEFNHIMEVLKKTSWRVSGKNGAAELLGLKPTTLESRMKKLGIKRPK
ncbi:MAG: sigma 54-interacting transcriptional regulator [Desulfobacterales bacterium]